MPSGRYTLASRLRMALRGLPGAAGRSADLIDQVQRIIRGAPEDKTRLLESPLKGLEGLIEQLPEESRAQASTLLQGLLDEAWDAVHKKGEVRKRETYRNRLREVEKAREEAAEAAAQEIAALRYALKCLAGPGHTPPPNAQIIDSRVARPPIRATFWQDAPWSCLRIEERTVGHHREEAFIRPDTKRPALRLNPETAKWMRWVRGIAQELKLIPASGQVREVFCPGLAYTFIAWMELPTRRPENMIHPMDPDNSVKPVQDALQTTPYLGEKTEFGAFANDTQVVDLLIYRLPQAGQAPVDRIAMGKVARQGRRERKRLKAAQAALDLPPGE